MKKILKDGGVEIRQCNTINYFTPYRESEKKKFGIILTDPILLDPEIKEKKLLNKEIYDIYTESTRYDGTQKGQLVLGLIFHSMREMFDVYIELKRFGYRVKIENEGNSKLDSVLYSLDTLEDNIVDFVACWNVLRVQILARDLERYKLDLLTIGLKLGYRFYWGDENNFENRAKTMNIINKTIIK